MDKDSHIQAVGATALQEKPAQEDPALQYLAQFDNDLDAAVRSLQEKATELERAKRPEATGPVVVKLEQVSKEYKLGRQKVSALKEVSLDIKEGEFVSLTGPSGSGKSTLLQLIGALDKPTSGHVIVNDKDISRLKDRELSVFRNKTVGFVFQFFYLQPFLNVKTNMEVPAMFARHKRSDRSNRSEVLADAVGLSDRIKHKPKELSGGQMQRVAIARALLNQPKIILADEPTGNLDSANGQAIIDLFEKVRDTYGTTVIIVTHDPKVARRTDREIKLEDGRIL